MNLQESARILEQTKKDLINKKHFPKYAMQYLTDPQMLNAAIHNYVLEQVKQWQCPVCQITIKAPKQWMIQHLHSHKVFFKDRKENEVIEHKVNPYFY